MSIKDKEWKNYKKDVNLKNFVLKEDDIVTKRIADVIEL